MTAVVQYHVFWDRSDQWFDDYEDAFKHYTRLGDCDKRLYVETYESVAAYDADRLIDEECLLSNGDYPV